MPGSARADPASPCACARPGRAADARPCSERQRQAATGSNKQQREPSTMQFEVRALSPENRIIALVVDAQDEAGARA
ncbi:hypothetical protein PPH41_37030, partial [Burkholderia gladioli]|nr:hypothetical protein [Burkholderia gladioli]